MEQLVEKINSSVACSVVEMKNLKELVINRRYEINDLKPLKTRFGRSILLTLYDDIEKKCYRCFSTKKISNSLSDEIINQITSSERKLALIYKGEIKAFEKSTVTSPLVEFVYEP